MISVREPDLGYTIGDAVSFTRFITHLRHFVAEHPDKEDILYHQVLAKQRAEQPARWLHIKLEVVEDKKTLSTTLLIRDDDLYVHGFMNQEGVCYELLETKDNGSEATAKLVTEGLGMSFAIEAVRRLSSSTHPDVEVDGEKSARVALAGLIVMVCESARMNPLRDAIAGGWSNGTGFTEQLMDRYVRKYGEMSRNLQKWKSSNSDNWPHPISELQATCLVLNTQLLPDETVDRPVGRPRVELLSIHADLGGRRYLINQYMNAGNNGEFGSDWTLHRNLGVLVLRHQN
uniref:rRNA N-glycosylase n=1 Tax=Setaria italica TaxID=4555 RepID=K3ZJG4_SETIT